MIRSIKIIKLLLLITFFLTMSQSLPAIEKIPDECMKAYPKGVPNIDNNLCTTETCTVSSLTKKAVVNSKPKCSSKQQCDRKTGVCSTNLLSSSVINSSSITAVENLLEAKKKMKERLLNQIYYSAEIYLSGFLSKSILYATPQGSNLNQTSRVALSELSSASIRNIDISAAGEKISYMTVKINPTTGEVLPIQIRQMNLDGSGDEPLIIFLNQSPTGMFDQPTWSPDGKILVFSAEAVRYVNPQFPASLNVLNGDPNQTNRIWAVSSDKTNFRQIGPDYASGPSVSPNSQEIAYFFHGAASNAETIGVVNSDGTSDRILIQAPNDVNLENLTWTPDGQKLLFAANADLTCQGTQCTLVALQPGRSLTRNATPSDLFLINKDGTNLKKITNLDSPQYGDNAPNVNRPIFSPDGDTIYFLSDKRAAPNDSATINLWSISVDGTNLKQLSHFQNVKFGKLQFNYNKTRIFFSSNLDPSAVTYPLLDLRTNRIVMQNQEKQIAKVKDQTLTDTNAYNLWSMNPDGTDLTVALTGQPQTYAVP